MIMCKLMFTKSYNLISDQSHMRTSTSAMCTLKCRINQVSADNDTL